MSVEVSAGPYTGFEIIHVANEVMYLSFKEALETSVHIFSPSIPVKSGKLLEAFKDAVRTISNLVLPGSQNIHFSTFQIKSLLDVSAPYHAFLPHFNLDIYVFTVENQWKDIMARMFYERGVPYFD